MSLAKDITDLRDQNGTSTLLNSITTNRRAVETIATGVGPNDYPPIVSRGDRRYKLTTRPPELIHGILHKGSKMVLGGGSKSYKTWSLLDLAMSVAAGEPWWGFQTTKARVLYVNMELYDWSADERMTAIETARPELIKGVGIDIWNLKGYGASFDKMRPIITDKVNAAYDLVIVDPIYKVYGNRDENSAGEMGELLNEIERLSVDTGAAVIFGAHFSKGNQAGKESIDRISGSGVFARDPDTILVMTKHEMEETFTVEATLRNFKPIESFCVQRVHPLMVRNDQLDANRLKQPGFKIKYTAEQLREVLGDQTLTTTAWYLRTAQKTGMSRSTFMAKLSELKADPTKITLNENEQWSVVKPVVSLEKDKSEGPTGPIAPTGPN